MSAHWVGARVRRKGGAAVLVPVGGGETVFLEEGEAPPAGQAWWARLDAEGRPVLGEPGPGGRDLYELLLVLWPAGGEALEARLRERLDQDNRLDLESGLQRVAGLVEGILAWWQALPDPFVRARLASLGEHDPALRNLLERPVDPQAARSDARSGEAPWAAWPGLFLAPPEPGPVADEARWEAWRTRGLEELLGARGGLASLMGEGYELREGQLQMAESVAKVLERNEHLMVEAGTGIGKSLAYLLPALLHGARSGERVVVSTYTKALQEQLVGHDLPLLQRLGYPGTARLLLGRNNYLCRRQLRHALRSRPRDAAAARAQLAFALWSQQSATGRREELSSHPFYGPHWRAWFDSVEPCSPHICHPEPSCFVVRARRLARDAEVVVVNHSLLMMDLRSRQGLMGPSRVLVVDEAHQLPDVATRALSHWVSPDRMEVYHNLAGDAPPRAGELREVPAALARRAAGHGLAGEVEERARAADAALAAFQGDFRRWYGTVEEAGRERLGEHQGRFGRHRYHDGAEAFGPAAREASSLLEAGDRLDRALAGLLARAGDLEAEGVDVADEREGLASLLEFHRDFVQTLSFCMEADDEDWVYWMEWGGERGLDAIVAAPLTVEEPLATLWDDHYHSVVMTSATLAVADDFAPFAEGVGFTKVSRFTDSLQVPSPFRFDEQCLVLTSLELPTVDEHAFPLAVAQLVAQVASHVATKSLVLSTSYRFLDQLEPALRQALQEARSDLFDRGRDAVEPELLVQRPGESRLQLTERFRRAPAAVLLATGAFWEGVDFPGRELELLVVPRLPFAVPTEPVTQGRGERAKRLGRDPFQDVTLVDAVLRLKQGVGRLLRSQEDRGVVLLLDSRLQSKPYGVTFLNSLPRTCELLPDLGEMADRVVEFLGGDAPRARRGRMR